MTLISKGQSKLQFYKLMISYIVLVFIVISMLYPLYNNTLTIVKEKALKESETALINGLESWDSLMYGIDQTIYNLYTNTDIKDLSKINGMLETKDYYKMMTAQRYIRAAFAPYSIVQDAFVIFKNNDIVITERKSYDTRAGFYQNYMSYEGQSADQWLKQVIGNYHNRELWPEQNVNTVEKGKGTVLTYMTSLPINSLTNYYSAVGIIIDKNSILKLLATDEVYDEGWLYIQDMYGNILLRHNYTEAPLDLKRSGRSEIQIRKQKTAVIYQSSEGYGFKVVAGIPEKVFRESVNSTRTLLFIYVGLAMLTGVIVAAFFAYGNSRPVQKLLSYIENIGFRTAGGKNEFESIKSAIDQLYLSKEHLNAEITNQRKLALTGLLERLFRNGIYTASELETAKKYFSDFPSAYRLVVMKYTLYATEDSDEKKQEDEKDLLRVFLISILKESYNQDVIIHPTGECYIAILVPQIGENHNEREEVEKFLRHMQQKILEKCEINTIYGISNRYSGIENVGTAFHEAQQILRFGEDTPEGSILWYERPFIDEHGIKFEFYDAQKLYQLLLAGEKDSLLMLMNKIYSDNEKVIIADNKMWQQHFYTLRSIFVSASSEVQNGKININIPEYSEDISPAKLFNSLISLGSNFCDEIQKRKRSHNNTLKEAILCYINSNYSDPNIFARSVADNFKISEKYLFSFVKEQTGKSFSDYLEDARLGHAIRLMKESKRPIGQIAIDVGFTSQNSFSRAFKRVYGISPSAWRLTFAEGGK